jgi:predicted NUDIX family phosphoesterase
VTPEEHILCIPTQVLHAAGRFDGLSRDVARLTPLLLDPAHFTFQPRAAAELDPTWKQLIPYVVLKCGAQLYHYRRAATGREARLHAKRSVGVGGHINPVDLVPGTSPYLQGMQRELAEEVTLATQYHEQVLGFINDDRTPVGQVHLGIVHLLELAEPAVRRREAHLADDGFSPLAQLREHRDAFESWSQFVLDTLSCTFVQIG